MLNIFKVMQKSKSIGIAAAIQAWLDSESVSFTAICGEQVTHREVLQTAAGIMLLASAICCGIRIINLIATAVAGGAA